MSARAEPVLESLPCTASSFARAWAWRCWPTACGLCRRGCMARTSRLVARRRSVSGLMIGSLWALPCTHAVRVRLAGATAATGSGPWRRRSREAGWAPFSSCHPERSGRRASLMERSSPASALACQARSPRAGSLERFSHRGRGCSSADAIRAIGVFALRRGSTLRGSGGVRVCPITLAQAVTGPSPLSDLLDHTGIAERPDGPCDGIWVCIQPGCDVVPVERSTGVAEN